MTSSGYFGEKWDAPVTDDLKAIPTPVGEPCMYCREVIQEGDAGLVNAAGWPSHKECPLRSVMGGIGHHVDHARYCKGEFGPDAGLSFRESAELVWRWHVYGERASEDELERRRREGRSGEVQIGGEVESG